MLQPSENQGTPKMPFNEQPKYQVLNTSFGETTASYLKSYASKGNYIQSVHFEVVMLQPETVSDALGQHILLFVDNWFKTVYKQRVFNSKSELLISQSFKETKLELKLRVLESNISKGVILPYFTTIKYKLVQNTQQGDNTPLRTYCSHNEYSVSDGALCIGPLPQENGMSVMLPSASKDLFTHSPLTMNDIGRLGGRPIPLISKMPCQGVLPILAYPSVPGPHLRSENKPTI